MATSPYADPYTGLYFTIELDNVACGGFQKAEGLDIKNSAIEYREGNAKTNTVNKVPGLTSYANIKLSRGLTDDDKLYAWAKETVDGKTVRKSGSIVLMDSTGKEKLRWTFERGFVVDWSGPVFDAQSNQVARESIEIATEGVAKK